MVVAQPASGSKGSRRAPARRRQQGSGGIFEVGDGLWRVDVEIGRDPVTGRRRRVSRTVRGTREDAEVAVSRLKVADHEKRLPSGTNARSVAAVLELYLATAETGTLELAPRTVATVRSAARLMSTMELLDGRTFGAIPLGRLNWQDIEQLYAAMRATGRSAAWIRRCATVLTRALDLARKRGLIDANPSRDAVRPKTVRKKPFAPLDADVRELLAAVGQRDPEMADMAILLASTGMRVGEFLGLWWEDVDLSAPEVHIGAAVTDGGPGIGILRKPTKRSDWRDVPLTTAAVGALERRRDGHRSRFGSDPPPGSYVFGGVPDGSAPLRPDILSHRWQQIRGTSTITLLELRHFAATRMLDAGESYRTVADILGNSEATLRLHYDGRTSIEKRKAITALEL